MRTSNRKLNFLFIIDSFKKLDLRYDTSLALMIECQKRGHRVFYAEPKEIVLTNHTVRIKASETTLARSIPTLVHVEWIDASKFDYIFIRKDPPVDLEYIYMTHKLEYVPNHVRIINRPKGIRDTNEKIVGLRFKKWMPASVVTSSLDGILTFQSSIHSDVILKPLNRKGGEGILLLPKHSNQKEKIIRKSTRNGTESVIAQKFIKKGLTEGDKRILIWDGKMIGAFGRVPKRGEFRANISCGGSFVKTKITKREMQIVRAVNPFLRKMGLLFVGLDLIDGWITEINVTSPAGIVDIQELYGIHLEKLMINSLEQKARRQA